MEDELACRSAGHAGKHTSAHARARAQAQLGAAHTLHTRCAGPAVGRPARQLPSASRSDARRPRRSERRRLGSCIPGAVAPSPPDFLTLKLSKHVRTDAVLQLVQKRHKVLRMRRARCPTASGRCAPPPQGCMRPIHRGRPAALASLRRQAGPSRPSPSPGQPGRRAGHARACQQPSKLRSQAHAPVPHTPMRSCPRAPQRATCSTRGRPAI